MLKRVFMTLAALTFVLSAGPLSAAAAAPFAPSVSFSDSDVSYDLTFTGSAMRTVLFVKVYDVAHYLQDPIPGSREQIFQQIFSDSQAKQFVFSWLYKAGAKKIREGFLESFHRDLNDASYQQYQNEINQFLDLYVCDANVGDQHVIRWLPGGVIEIECNGQWRGEIVNVEFANILWGIWLGPKSALDRMALISDVVAR